MLGLPKNTELKKQISKNLVFAKFETTSAAQSRFDADVSKIFIVNELSPQTTNIVKGKIVSCIFVMHIFLKNADFDEKNIALIAKAINQTMLFVLEHENKTKLALFHTKLIQGPWQASNTLSIKLEGLNFDSIWERLVVQVGAIEIAPGKSLEQQIIDNEQRKKQELQIAKLEKLARAEKQPKRKFELVTQIQNLKKLHTAGE